MATYTLSPVPTDGGTFSLTSRKFDWCALTDDKFLIVYQQNSPARLFAQVVNFNGTNQPSFESAFVISSLNIPEMVPKIIALNNTQAFVAYYVEDSSAGTYRNIEGLLIEIDGSDNIITHPQDSVGNSAFPYFNMALHEGTTNTIRIYANERYNDSFDEPRTYYVVVNLSDGSITSGFYNLGNFNNSFDPGTYINIQSISNGNVFGNIGPDGGNNSDILIMSGSSSVSDIIWGSVVSPRTTVSQVLTDGLIIGADGNGPNLITREYDSNGIIATRTINNIFNSIPAHLLVLDEEHCIFMTAGGTAGTREAYVLRIPDSLNYINNPNNPIAISDGIIEDIDPFDKVRTNALYINSTLDRLHYTGIADDGSGGTIISFQLHTP